MKHLDRFKIIYILVSFGWHPKQNRNEPIFNHNEEYDPMDQIKSTRLRIGLSLSHKETKIKGMDVNIGLTWINKNGHYS